MEKVLVTGGSGYIALHCISQLLFNGYFVRTSVRNKKKEDEVKNAIVKSVGSDDNLEFCILDLMKDNGWDKATQDCDYVLHLASPVFFSKVENDDVLVKPAREGLMRAVKSSSKNNIKRFVMTSSFAAVGYGHSKDLYTEDHWSDLSKKNLGAYNRSKTEAEMALWNFIDSSDNTSKMEACTINPTVVLGQSLSKDVGMSNTVVKKLLDGSIPFSANISFGVVDVKDVAAMHIEAMKNQNAAGKRFIMSERCIWYKDMANILRENGFHKAPKYVAPNILLRIYSLFDTQVKAVIPTLGLKKMTNSNNAKSILGWSPTNIKTSILETAKQMRDLGIIN